MLCIYKTQVNKR